MTLYEKTTGGEVYLRGIDRRVSAGDRVDVNEEFGDYLRERGDFRPVDVQDADSREVDDTDDAETSADGETGGFDLDEWLDRPYQERADRVLDGNVDEQLETIDEAETSDTVQDAVGQRRAELEA